MSLLAAAGIAVAVAKGAAVVGGTIVGMAAVSAIDEELRNTNTLTKVLPKPGSILITRLTGEWHSGIYIGNNRIAEVKGGKNSRVRSVSPDQFRDDGVLRKGINIFIACDKDTGNVISRQEIANKAKSKIGQKVDYLLIIDNCHQFSRGCITGNFKGDDGEAIIETKRNLGKSIRKNLNYGDKIVWCSWETE